MLPPLSTLEDFPSMIAIPAEPAAIASSSQLTSPLRNRRVASRSELLSGSKGNAEITENCSVGRSLAWVDCLPDAACLVDDTGAVVRHNHAFEQLIGFIPGETDNLLNMWGETEYAAKFYGAVEKSRLCEGSFSFLIGFDEKLLSTEWWMSGHRETNYILVTARNLVITPLYQLYKDMEEYRQLHEEMLRCGIIPCLCAS